MQEAYTQQTQSQPLRLVAEGFFRHWRMFTLVCTGIFLLAAAATFASKKQYRSETKFLLENNRSNTVITADRNSSPAIAQITEQQLNSEMEVMSSEDVIGAVADPGWNPLTVAAQTPAALKLHEQQLTNFRKHLSLEPVRKANVIVVGYTASSPVGATRVLERFSAAYLGHRKLLTRPGGISNFFAGEALRYRDAWQHANSDLVGFQQQHQIVSVQEAEDALNKQALGYEEDLRSNEASLAEMRVRVAASERAASELPARQQTQEHTIANQTSTEEMRTLLVQLQNRRTEMLTRYTPQNRLVAEVDHQIANTQVSLAEALAQKAHEDTTDINPAWQQVQNSLVEERIERQALQSKNATIAQSLGALRARLAQMQALDVNFNMLEEKADRARSNFELFSEKSDQAQIEDAMDQHKLVNIAVAESPTSTYNPVSPKPLLNAALGLLTALFLAVAAVYFAESGRNTIGSPRELEAFSRFPVLATLPYGSMPVAEPGVLHSERVMERRYETSPRMEPVMQNLRESHPRTGGYGQ